MGLAIKFAERRLRPYQRSDETITEYDIADVPPMGKSIPVVLTQRAIYFVNNLRSIRVPYQHIFDLQARGKQIVAFSTKSGNAFLIQIQGTPKGDMYHSIAVRLKEGVVKHQQLVEIPQGTVVAVCRRIEEDGGLRVDVAGE